MANYRKNPSTISSKRSRDQFKEQGIPLPSAVDAAIVQAVCAAAVIAGPGVDITKGWLHDEVSLRTIVEGAIKILRRKRDRHGRRLYRDDKIPRAVINRLHRDRIDPGSNHALASWVKLHA